MNYQNLGAFDNVSRLTLGGAGIGNVWGETSTVEALSTIAAALEGGINVIDTAPMYGKCEELIATAFAGSIPRGVRITSKCQLGKVPAGESLRQLNLSLENSLQKMNLDAVDIYFLHSNICDDDFVYRHGNEHRDQFATPWSQYIDDVVPAFEEMKFQGKIKAWGITATGVPSTLLRAIDHEVRPDVIQAVANLLDSPGGMRRYDEEPQPRQIIKSAVQHGIGVMGIRAVQAGALTTAIDRELSERHPDMVDFVRAEPFRELCTEIEQDPAVVAHRYSLTMFGVDTVILGVKNRAELDQCLSAESDGPLSEDVVSRIDSLGLK